jgi:hypothetical protein
MRRAEALLLLLGCSLAASAHAGGNLKYRNLTAGGELRPGVYGRIDPGPHAPPPVIFKQPVVGAQVLVPAGTRPVYLYVPPGQVRKWGEHCRKWHACDAPVYFVRMDDSPGRLGNWSRRKDAYAAVRTDD